MDRSLYVNRCLQALQRAASALGGDPGAPAWPVLAEMVIQAMSGPWRSFHTPEHIFDVGEGGSPTEVIAALFHDLVYVQVDQGINLSLARHLADAVEETREGLKLNPAAVRQDPLLHMTVALFGFAHDQRLNPFAGQNEFLSAVVAVRSMRDLLAPAVLARVVACIEATVPFRAAPAEGPDCSALLRLRLQAVNQEMQLGLDEQDLTQAVETAVRVANRDVGNFASEHPAQFLDNTWNLIPETNHDLVQVNVYTVRGYRTSLQKMEGFLSSLQAANVFRRYGAEPDADTHQQRLALTQRNLQVACDYLRIKLVSVGLLEALSLRIGTSVSLASLMGKLSAQQDAGPQLEHLLPSGQQTPPATNAVQSMVVLLLESGRTADSVHDARHSPVASYLVRQMGYARTLALHEQAKAFFADTARAESLLQAFPAEVTEVITRGVQTLFQQRSQALLQPAS
ncbi:MAG: hypothetical protein ACKOFG_01005 [Limnohabitans sp.]